MLTAVVCSGTNRPQSSMPQWESMARALYRPGERRVVGSRLAGPAVMAGYRAGCGAGYGGAGAGCGGGHMPCNCARGPFCMGARNGDGRGMGGCGAGERREDSGREATRLRSVISCYGAQPLRCGFVDSQRRLRAGRRGATCLEPLSRNRPVVGSLGTAFRTQSEWLPGREEA